MKIETNYDLALKRGEQKFLCYDQGEMIEKCGLKADDDYLYLTFFHQPYRIGRKTGHVERMLPDGGFADIGYYGGMAVFDILCDIKPGRYLANVWQGTEKFSNTFCDGSDLYVAYALRFDGHSASLQAACEKYGGVLWGNHADVSYILPAFEFFPVVFRFWEGDDELPATIRFFWDANMLEFILFDSAFYLMNHILENLWQEIAVLDRQILS